MERLKAFSIEKFTLDGRKFHLSTILSAKYLLRVQLGLYSLYAWPLVAIKTILTITKITRKSAVHSTGMEPPKLYIRYRD